MIDFDFSLLPMHFFDVSFPVKYAKNILPEEKYLLGNTEQYLDGEDFTSVYMAWNENGIFLDFKVQDLPDSEKGSIELFFDTRNLKTKGYITKYCHHFICFPFEDAKTEEITKFREDDMHELKSPGDFESSVVFGKDYYLVKMFIPGKCLYGYDPSQFDKLGFTYKINGDGKTQFFSVSSKELSIEKMPFFWATLLLNRD